MTGSADRAIVVGASIAGLLAARVLTETYAQVVLVDRDELPSGPVARSGVPHSRNSHALLAGGRQAIEDLLPGITDQLVAGGADLGDVQDCIQMHVGPRPMARGTCGVQALAVSRPLLEWAIRERVAALPGVVFHDRTSALDLAFSADESAVTGVVLAPLDDPRRRRVLEGGLVVDASGRTSRTPGWLERRGYPVPEEERVRCDLTTVTRRFRRHPGQADGYLAVMQPPAHGLPRRGILLAQEGDEWTAAIAGYHGVRPPTEPADYVAYARTLAGQGLAEVLEQLDPIGDAVTYRFQANVRRRYERLDRFPEGLLVIGDALSAFDPAFGQGMSVAALEAKALRALLLGSPGDLAGQFFRRAAEYIDTPWQIVVGGMPKQPGVSEHEPRSARVRDAYVRALCLAATEDPVLAGAFLRVAQLTAPPRSLMKPTYAIRVLSASLRRDAVHRWGVGRTVSHRPPGRRGPVRQHHTIGTPL